jgi:hypothetical protein
MAKKKPLFHPPTQRTLAIAQHVVDHPELTYAEIGTIYGRSPYAVGAIALRRGVQRGRNWHTTRKPYNVHKVGELATKSNPERKLREKALYCGRREARKVEDKIIEYVQAHPERTYREIGNIFGLKPFHVSNLMYRRAIKRSRVGEEAKAFKAEVAAYVSQHPKESYADIGRKFNVPTLFVGRVAREAGHLRGKGQGPRHNGGRTGWSHTEENREKFRQFMTEVWESVSPRHRQRLSKLMKARWGAVSREKLATVLTSMWREAKKTGAAAGK